ncbi:hypothetical protein DTO96_100838 [Ephemeroptericola cinctiostellae]|uniref:DUF2127 domain-containing protein n=1 Tax=Ephemeroptericola cinctiostellae TaxID=2268024 RepID=A0A345D9T1_9BURK|nr:DUF2127 domain-containing protein [Ephemeroptericola cinctiostellae]AXF85119.1 hypothetical protein DTO96_100838 [Ephemeroptericola cinctiostellae]
MNLTTKKRRNPLHWIACFEAAKGVVVILAGFGLLSLLHRDVQAVVHELIDALNISPTHHLVDVFLKLVEHLNDRNLWQFAGIAFMYASVRLIEAYGLWHDRQWAEWFAALSGAIYLPIEVYELSVHLSTIKLLVFTFNVVIVSYLSYNLWHKSVVSRHQRK